MSITTAEKCVYTVHFHYIVYFLRTYVCEINIIFDLSLIQTERFTEFPDFTVDSRVGISRSA